VPRKRRVALRALVDELARVHPELPEARERILAGDVRVDGVVRTNPASLVRVGASIVVGARDVLRGEAKLKAALSAFAVPVSGRVALDVGAAAGGFTRVLLAAGARRVYGLDAGHGQLLGSLRADPRVVNLESTNLGVVNRTLVPDVVEIVTLDLSYLSLQQAVPQLEQVAVDHRADAIALVKPQFELGLAALPTTAEELSGAVQRAREAFERGRWTVLAVIESPVRGAGGAIEFLLHARRS
jgi:23S rRNA (cytidine1920-2'-O)/16S rRNA (cytidine1409-2'-O)-methyltransferase